MDRPDKIALDRMGDEVKKLVHRMEVMQKSLDILYEDRGILEDLQGQFRALQEQFSLVRGDQERRSKDLKYEIQEVHEKVGMVGTAVEKNIGALVTEVSKKQVMIIREGFFGRLKKFLKGGAKT